MGASRLVLINYLCMMLIGVTLFIHLATHAFLGVSSYEESLTFDSVVGRYQSPATAAMLTVLLLTLVYHSVYSFRTFLLELKVDRPAKREATLASFGIGHIAQRGNRIQRLVVLLQGKDESGEPLVATAQLAVAASKKSVPQ